MIASDSQLPAPPEDWATGDATGLPIAADAEALHTGGPDYLTHSFRASGAIGPRDRVEAITRFEPVAIGGTGSKLLLSVRYAEPAPAAPTELFVKFSRNPHDPIRDSMRHHMESEIRLANLSRTPGFPIAVPQCLFADFDRVSGTGILVTERIAFGDGGIEPHHPKCCDYRLAEPLAHYEAIVRALARLSGTHKAGRLPAEVADRFPFDRATALATDPLPEWPRLQGKIARLKDFAGRHPQLLPAHIAAPAFLGRYEEEARLLLDRQEAVKRFLYAQPDFIALCHWNANIDNAWFWRGGDGTLQCGLMDWGSVGQMHLAMTLLGSLSGGELGIWNEHLGTLIDLFVREFAASGGPALDTGELLLHLKLYTAMMGTAYLLDAPARIRREIADLDMIESRTDPAFVANETARVQLHNMTNYLNLWHASALGELLPKLAPAEAEA